MLQEPYKNTNKEDPNLPKLIRWEEIRGIPARLASVFSVDAKRITDLENAVVALQTAIGKIYIGSVTTAGVADNPFPTGWSVSRTSEGVYVVTHNFGDSDGYVVSPSLDDTTQGLTIVYERDSNSFDIEITDGSGVYDDANFSFIVIKT